jgi:DNA-binding transcriptional ArsR family regulator
MNTKQVLMALAALAQETRLRIFRLLVKVGPTGLAAGAIGEQISAAPATLSFHLKELERAGLLTSRRESRQIYYAADFEGMGDLLAFLSEDCCQGHPAVRSQSLLSSSSRKRSASAQRSKQ